MFRRLVPILAFALPFAAYWLWRRARAQTGVKAWPLTILFVAGAVLAAQTMLIAAVSEPHRLQRSPDPVESGPPLYKDHPP